MSAVARGAAVVVLAAGVAFLALRASRPGAPQPLGGTVDAEGYFLLDEGAPAEVYPASGVSIALGRSGRLSGEGGASVWTRRRGGDFVRRPLALRAGDTHDRALFDAVREFAEARCDIRFPYWMHRAHRPFDWQPSPPADLAIDGAIVRPRGSLTAWAPADRPFVRFRSVEAAFRFAGIADALAARIAAARWDGRSYQTLRWAFHDLLLPTIWMTNPSAMKGTGECGLILDGPLFARPRAAVVFQVTDPELHDMQTRAGIAQEAHDDHLWRPADDPFPVQRDRRNHRVPAGDFEVVATEPQLLSEILQATETHADGTAWRTARAAQPRIPDEAFLAVLPEGDGWAKRDWDPGHADSRWSQEISGVAWLLERWTGFRFDGTAEPRPARVQRVPDFRPGLRVVRAVTDGEGAHVTCEFADAGSAAATEELLALAARPLANHADVCRDCRRDLALVAIVPARDEPGKKRDELAERCFVVLGFRPVCPAGGRFSAHPITRVVQCSAHGTNARPREVADPGPVLRDLKRDGTTVTFTWPIDWERKE